MQRTIPLGPHRIADIRDIPAHLVAQCRDYIDAVNLCMNESTVKRTRRAWASLLDEVDGKMKEGTLNLILNRGGKSERKRTLDPNYFDVIQRLAGNRAISQFFDMQSKGLLNHQSADSRIKQLEAELAQLKHQERLSA